MDLFHVLCSDLLCLKWVIYHFWYLMGVHGLLWAFAVALDYLYCNGRKQFGITCMAPLVLWLMRNYWIFGCKSLVGSLCGIEWLFCFFFLVVQCVVFPSSGLHAIIWIRMLFIFFICFLLLNSLVLPILYLSLLSTNEKFLSNNKNTLYCLKGVFTCHIEVI